MKYYVDQSVRIAGDGSQARPFKSIQAAAERAKAGDIIDIAPGIYREYVNPQHGGTEDSPIVYRGSVDEAGNPQVVISGAEVISAWEKQDQIWKVQIPNSFFGSYNPYTTLVQGDWYFEGEDYHTGEIYLNDQSMYEVHSLDEVMDPQPNLHSWESPEKTLLVWYTEQADDQTIIYANFGDKNPNEETVEINVRRRCLFPQETGRNYITLEGIHFTKAAPTWAPPTAFQDGMVGVHWSKGWLIQDCEFSHAKCSGLSLGKYLQPENENKWTRWRYKDGTQNERDAICQAQREGWTKEQVGSHIVRHCHFHHCEQTGIVGHLGGVFSLIEDNHIHHINNKQQLRGAEIAGIKMHAAIDVVYRRNHIHHCTRGLWLDWQAQGTRVTQNLFHDNMPPEHVPMDERFEVCEDLFVEVSHGPTLVDRNIFLSICSAKLATQGLAFVHNLFAGSFTDVGHATDHPNGQPRYTPYHVPHRTEIQGFMSFLHGDARFYNNIFVQKEVPEAYRSLKTWLGNPVNFDVGTVPYKDYPSLDEWKAIFAPDADRAKTGDPYFHKLPVCFAGNVYFNGAKPAETTAFESFAEPVHLELKEDEGRYYLETNLYEQLKASSVETKPIHTQMLGMAFEPEQRFEAADGSDIHFDHDFFDEPYGIKPLPGPFKDPGQVEHELNEGTV